MIHDAVNHVDHIAVLVRDVDESLPAFLQRFGLTLLQDERLPEAGVRVAYLDAGNTLIQLVEPLGPGPLLDHLEQHGEGLHHVCFAVGDIEATIARLAPGTAVPVRIGGRGRRTAFLPPGPSGLRAELTEIEPVTELRGIARGTT